MKIGSVSPTPKMKRPSGIQAMPEIGLRSSTRGSTSASAVLFRPMRKPRGMALAIATPRLSTSLSMLTEALSKRSPSRARSTRAEPTTTGVGSWIGLSTHTAAPSQSSRNATTLHSDTTLWPLASRQIRPGGRICWAAGSVRTGKSGVALRPPSRAAGDAAASSAPIMSTIGASSQKPLSSTLRESA